MRVLAHVDRQLESAAAEESQVLPAVVVQAKSQVDDGVILVLGRQDIALPVVEPKAELSVYAELGYRFSPRWSLIGYYDGYRFGESSAARVTSSDATACSPATPPCPLSFFQPASSVDSFGLRLQYNFR